jgi:protein gp37
LLNFFSRVRFISIEPLLEPFVEIDLTAIDWVIVGGESGTGARPIHPWWWKYVNSVSNPASLSFSNNRAAHLRWGH